MVTIIRTTVWNFLASLPSGVELFIWIILFVSIIALVEVIVFSIRKFIINKNVDIKLKNKLANEHQLKAKELEKQEAKEAAAVKDKWTSLAWILRWRAKELLIGIVVVLVIVIVGLVILLNFNYSKTEGATMKPTVKIEDLKKLKK